MTTADVQVIKTWPGAVVEVYFFLCLWMLGRIAVVFTVHLPPPDCPQASARGLPIVLSSFLPGQEAGNVPYVVRNGFGAFRRRPENIARTVMDWIVDPIKMADLSRSVSESRLLATESQVERAWVEHGFNSDKYIKYVGPRRRQTARDLSNRR
ncbi:hypothetical protein T492DRAFT_374697 [Pavlovales sp. CCMP2436]|nr:hypothetical protein T492DRAFT_374697 [Pavlovales sp. CCMP2436]